MIKASLVLGGGRGGSDVEMRWGGKKKKISVLLAPRCLAALFKSYWSSINTFNCFLWFPGLWSVAFQGEAAFLTLLHTWVYPGRHALGQNVRGKAPLCLLGKEKKTGLISTDRSFPCESYRVLETILDAC